MKKAIMITMMIVVIATLGIGEYSTRNMLKYENCESCLEQMKTAGEKGDLISAFVYLAARNFASKSNNSAFSEKDNAEFIKGINKSNFTPHDKFRYYIYMQPLVEKGIVDTEELSADYSRNKPPSKIDTFIHFALNRTKPTLFYSLEKIES